MNFSLRETLCWDILFKTLAESHPVMVVIRSAQDNNEICSQMFGSQPKSNSKSKSKKSTYGAYRAMLEHNKLPPQLANFGIPFCSC
jgi:hypothetical protein